MEISMDANSEAELRVLFKSDEVERLMTFLDQDGGFSFAGELVIVSAFIELQEYSPFSFILEGCNLEWPNSWSKQSSDVRGDLNADGFVGMRNRIALETLYNRSEIHSPLEGFKLHIPSCPLFVTTRWEFYEFGEADSTGWRTVTRLKDELFFKECIIGSFRGEKPMELQFRIAAEIFFWHTAVVLNYKLHPA